MSRGYAIVGISTSEPFVSDSSVIRCLSFRFLDRRGHLTGARDFAGPGPGRGSAPERAGQRDEIASLLRGRTLVAHDLEHVLAVLKASFASAGLVFPVSYESSLSTREWVQRSFAPARTLSQACRALGLPVPDETSSREQAEASTKLLVRVMQQWPTVPWDHVLRSAASLDWAAVDDSAPAAPVGGGVAPVDGATVPSRLAVLVGLADFEGEVEAWELYAAALDRVLRADRLTDASWTGLTKCARDLGIDEEARQRLHLGYYRALSAGAEERGGDTHDWETELRRVANYLAIPTLSRTASPDEDPDQGEPFGYLKRR